MYMRGVPAGAVAGWAVVGVTFGTWPHVGGRRLAHCDDDRESRSKCRVF